MATYTNPSSLLTPTDFKLTGPAAGAMSSIKDAYAFSDMNAANRDQDLAYLATLNKYQNQMADNPVLEATRQNALSGQQAEAQDWQSGVNRGLMTSAKNLQLSSDEAKTAAAKLQQSLTAGDTVVQLKQYLDSVAGENPELGLMNNPEHQKNIDEFRSRAKAAGVNLPEGDLTTPQNQAILDAKTKAFLNSRDMIQRQQIMAEQYAGKSAVAEVGANVRARSVADTLANRIRLQEMRGEQASTVESAYVKVMQKNGPLDPSDVVIVQQAASSNFDKTYQGKSPMTLFYTAAQDPKDELHDSAVQAEQAGIKDPNQFYMFAKKQYVDKVVTDVVQSHGGVKSPQGGVAQPQATPQAAPQAVQPQAATAPPRRQVQGMIGGNANFAENQGTMQPATQETTAPQEVRGVQGTPSNPWPDTAYGTSAVKKGDHYHKPGDPPGVYRIRQ